MIWPHPDHGRFEEENHVIRLIQQKSLTASVRSAREVYNRISYGRIHDRNNRQSLVRNLKLTLDKYEDGSVGGFRKDTGVLKIVIIDHFAY